MTIARRLLMAVGGGGTFTLAEPSNFMALFNGQNGDTEYKIGQATTTDQGVTWTEDAGNPTIAKSGAGWVSSHVKDPWLMPDGLSAYVAGYNGTHYQIGRVTRATLGSAWAYDSTSTPAVALGGGGDPDEHGCAFPVVLHEPGDTGKEYKVWYRGQDASGKLTVCYAYSSSATLASLTKVGVVLDTGGGGTWDVTSVLPACVVKEGSTYTLLYGGRSPLGSVYSWQGGTATFTDPEGAYTKAAGNPTQPARWHTADWSPAITTDVAIGDTHVHVAETAAFNVNEAVVLLDGDALAEPEVHTIVSVDSSTQVTVTPAAAGIMGGGGPVMRPMAGLSVIARSVIRLGTGSYLMFGTAFQPVDDLSVPTTTLREGSLRWTGTSMAGAWAYDYTPAGLLFPLYPAHTGWHKYAAENPSVIVAP